MYAMDEADCWLGDARKYLTGAQDDHTLHLRPISFSYGEAHGERARNHMARVVLTHDLNCVQRAHLTDMVL